jgi:hypothetical protein
LNQLSNTLKKLHFDLSNCQFFSLSILQSCLANSVRCLSHVGSVIHTTFRRLVVANPIPTNRSEPHSTVSPSLQTGNQTQNPFKSSTLVSDGWSVTLLARDPDQTRPDRDVRDNHPVNKLKRKEKSTKANLL